MPVEKRKTKKQAVKVPSTNPKHDGDTKALQKKQLDENISKAKIEVAKELHFVPYVLLSVVLVCSGALAILSYRDMFGTGKVIFGEHDKALLQFTGSTKWFDDSKGWKSTAGGFSAVKKFTTDENDMGGFFVRKMAGAAGLGFHLQKLVPLLFQRSDTHWGRGHFHPMLVTSALGDLAIAGYYMSHVQQLKSGDAHFMGYAIAIVFIFEAVIMLSCVLLSSCIQKVTSTTSIPGFKVKSFPPGKGPKSVVCKIVTRTFCIVTAAMALIAGRDFFFPGRELPFPPYDDIYLEWTGAFIHSPPPNTVEEQEYGMEAPLHIGDKFVSRLMALYILVTCFQKFVSGFIIRLGPGNDGDKKCKIFWQSQAIGDALLLFTMRVFAQAALSASLDLRWHVMSLGYETFILGLYAFS
jgi:hypothetical protein